MTKGKTDTLKARRIAVFAKVDKRPARRQDMGKFWRRSLYIFNPKLGSRRVRRADARQARRNVLGRRKDNG